MSRVQRADEQFIRQQIRKILAESHQELLLENEFGDFASPDEVYKTFIGPFVNVLKVAKTAFKDVSSATLITLSHAFSFSEKNREKLRAKYKIDRQKYQQEYAETMKDIDATLASSDAKLMAFMFNPGAFLGTQMIKQAADVGEPVTDYVKMRMDWISPELDAVFRDVDTKRGAEAGPVRGLLGDLKALFFGEGYQSVSPMLEAEDFVPLLEKGILASMFQGATAKARQELLQGVMDFVAEDMNPSEVQKFKEAGPLGEKYSDIIMNFSKELANL
jgi:hypothetical protein